MPHCRTPSRSRSLLFTLPWLLAAGLLALRAPPIGSQEPAPPPVTIRGSVFDSAGAPLADAQVLVLGSPRVVRTSARGEFLLERMDRAPAVLRVRRFGYFARTVIVEPVAGSDTVDLSIQLDPLAVQLAPVVVQAMEEKYTAKMAGFAERMKQAPRSSFLTRADIETIAPLRTKDLVARLATLRCSGGGVLYLDGVMTRSFNLDWINPNDIEAMEVYRGAATIPVRFNATLPNGSTPACVTVIWTR